MATKANDSDDSDIYTALDSTEEETLDLIEEALSSGDNESEGEDEDVSGLVSKLKTARLKELEQALTEEQLKSEKE